LLPSGSFKKSEGTAFAGERKAKISVKPREDEEMRNFQRGKLSELLAWTGRPPADKRGREEMGKVREQIVGGGR